MGRQVSAVWRVLDRVPRRPETPIVLCIDVEPDPLVFDPADPPPWLGFERLLQRLPALRRRLSEATGRAPLRAAEMREAARGLTPDYRGVPTRPYRSTPSRFPASDPAARVGPLLVPLLSPRSRRPPFRRVPLGLWEPFHMARL